MSVRVRVFTTDTLEGLCLTPEGGADRHDVRSLLAFSLPRVRVKSTPAGLLVPPLEVARLREVDGLELCWTEKAATFYRNRLSAFPLIPNLREEVEKVKALDTDFLKAQLSQTSDVGALDAHQLENVAAMTIGGLPGLCVFDEQGTGKTVTVVFAYDVLVARDLVDLAFIVAPKSMVPEWPMDFQKFKGDLYSCATITGSRKEKLAALRRNSAVLVTNYETVVGMEREIEAKLSTYGGRVMLVVDESFFIKNLDATRTRAIRRLRELCSKAYVLCGTPSPNSPLDIIQQFNTVDFGYAFGDTNLPKEPAAAREVVKSTMEKRGLYVRHVKDEVLKDLPARRFNRLLIPLAPEQREHYLDTLKGLTEDVQNTFDSEFKRRAMSFLARRTQLLQICSNPANVFPSYTETPAKLLALDELLEDLISKRKEKVVLWSFYTASIDALCERYTRFNPVRYDGTVPDVAVRREGVRSFQEDETTMLFVANPAAAGAGLTLHRARYAIYESMSNQAAHYLQSIDRIHRRGQQREVEYVIILTEGTVEISAYDSLLVKEQRAKELLGDPMKSEVTREAFLGELIESLRSLIHAESGIATWAAGSTGLSEEEGG